MVAKKTAKAASKRVAKKAPAKPNVATPKVAAAGPVEPKRIKILSRWFPYGVVYECEAETIREAVERAVANGASLEGASLVGARLEGASLVGARLVGARLDGASLVGASLEGARLDGASLVGARLDGASLVGASLDGARLDPIKLDFWKVLDAAPNEAAGLELALRESRVDGSTYTGECACLVGTIANIRGCGVNAVRGLTPDSSRPAERWFLAIRPECSVKHPVVAITLKWIAEWRERRPGAPAAVSP